MAGYNLSTKDYINKVLFAASEYSFFKENKPVRFLVHSDIVGNILMFLHDLEIDFQYKVFKYKLNSGTKLYNMCLISTARIISVDGMNIEKFKLLGSKIKDSQFSFAWEPNPNLFIEVGSFKILEEFITKHELEQFKIDVQEHVGIDDNDNKIKVVTFNPSANEKLENMVKKFIEHLKLYKAYHRPKYYYMALAFEWLSPQWFEQIYPNNNRDLALFVTVREVSYTNCSNIIDLISLRMALFPYGHAPSPLKGEIDYSINRELMKFVKNNHLDLTQYMIAKKLNPPEEVIIQYLVYEYENCFKTITFVSGTCTLTDSIRLVNKADALNKIKNNCNIEFEVDGSGYDQMSLSLFLDLVKCQNVTHVTLDTNYMWHHDVFDLNLKNDYLLRSVILKGQNTYNFVEDFVSSLKIIAMNQLTIYGNQINDYSIFDNINVRMILFFDININLRLLEQLHKCNLLAKIYFNECLLENTYQNWALLMELKVRIGYAYIKEDESTLQCLFEFVWDEMVKTNLIEFRFDKFIVEIISFNGNIILSNKIFKINEQNDKLEIYDADSNEIIDIYCSQNFVEPDDKSDYDFYQ